MKYFFGMVASFVFLVCSPLSFASTQHATRIAHAKQTTHAQTQKSKTSPARVHHVAQSGHHRVHAGHAIHHKRTHAQIKHHSTRAPTYAPQTPISLNQLDIANPETTLNKNSEGIPEIPNRKLVDFVLETVNHQSRSAYKFGGTHFDIDKGIYELDCSTYVDHVLADSNPNAYDKLVSATGTEKPTSSHFYDFFTHIRDYSPSEKMNRVWSRITDASELLPGDILVFRYGHHHSTTGGGHVMIVMDKPVVEDQAVLLKVADAAPTGHSEDTRPSHASGIGIGTLLLKVNKDDFSPSAYAWKIGSHWQSNVRIAMGRPASELGAV